MSEVRTKIITRDRIDMVKSKDYYNALNKLADSNKEASAFLIKEFDGIYTVTPLTVLETFAKGLDIAIKKRGLQKKDVAKAIKVLPSNLSIKLKGRRGVYFNIEDITEVQKLLDCEIVFRDGVAIFNL